MKSVGKTLTPASSKDIKILKGEWNEK
jgi:hypothetical protein